MDIEEAIEIVAALIPPDPTFTRKVYKTTSEPGKFIKKRYVRDEVITVTEEAREYYKAEWSTGGRRLTLDELEQIVTEKRDRQIAEARRKQEAFRILCAAARQS